MYKWEGQVIQDSSSTTLTNIHLNLASVDTTELSGNLNSTEAWYNYLYLILFVLVIYTFYFFMKKKK